MFRPHSPAQWKIQFACYFETSIQILLHPQTFFITLFSTKSTTPALTPTPSTATTSASASAAFNDRYYAQKPLGAEQLQRQKTQKEPSSSAHQLPDRQRLTEHLTIATTLVMLWTPIHQLMLKSSGFSPTLLNYINDSQQNMANYQASIGQSFTLIDLNHITGFSMLDSPIADLLRLLTYALFAVTLWLYSGRKLPIQTMIIYYIYAFAACLGFETLFSVFTDFVVLANHQQGQPYDMMLASSLNALASLPRLAFLFLLPILTFPQLFDISKGKMAKLSFLAIFSLGIGSSMVSQLMISSGVVIIFPSFT